MQSGPTQEHPSRRRKVFGIGLSRTGTRSLHAALELLGYTSVHFPWPRFRYGRLAARVGLPGLRLEHGLDQRFDALVDTSVLPVWKRLDARHPGARFVLTVRDKESWLEACSRFPPFQPGAPAALELRSLRRHVYGCEYFDRARFADAFDRHHAEIDEYFRGREGDLLRLDVCAGDGFDLLCPFLGVPLLSRPFPWENRHPAGR